ncbi:MAG: hypothetical protein QOF29_2247 [bacterium]
MLDGRDAVTLLSQPSPTPVRAVEWTGRAVPAHCTSAGRALLLDHDVAALHVLFAEPVLPAGCGAAAAAPETAAATGGLRG